MNSGIIDSVLSKRGVVAKLAKLPYYSYQKRVESQKGECHLSSKLNGGRFLFIILHYILGG